MKRIAASEIDGQSAVCKFLDAPDDDRPGDDRPEWLLERRGRLVKASGQRVWVRFSVPYSWGVGWKDYLMSWRELELREEAGA